MRVTAAGLSRYCDRVDLAPGLRAFVDIVVGDDDTAVAAGSGDVPVLATPRLLALAEAAAVAAVRDGLAPGVTSVGTSAALEHARPSPVGAHVVVEAELTAVDGRRLGFTFAARHAQPGAATGEGDVVGSGSMERALVDRARFLSRVQADTGGQDHE